MNQEANSKESADKSDRSIAEKSSEERSRERAESEFLEKGLEKIREGLESFREFLCVDGSQRATGQGSKGTLKDRATGTRPEEAPFHLGNDLLTGPELQSNEKKASESAKLFEFDFGVVDLSDLAKNGYSHLSYNRFHVEYHCDNGEISVNTPEGFLEAYKNFSNFKEKVDFLQKLVDRIEFLSEPHKVVGHISNFFSDLKDNLPDPTEASEKADITAESIREQKLLDANSFTRGLADWPTFRSERVALSDRGNTHCNMPDFKSPGIDRTFK